MDTSIDDFKIHDDDDDRSVYVDEIGVIEETDVTGAFVTDNGVIEEYIVVGEMNDDELSSLRNFLSRNADQKVRPFEVCFFRSCSCTYFSILHIYYF